MSTEIGPKDQAVTIKFGSGIHSRASEEEIDIRECATGQNFSLDAQDSTYRNRKPFDLVGVVPNGLEIRGFASLLKADGTTSMLVQAGGVVYEYTGTSFVQVGTCDATAQLRGRIEHNWQLADKVIITDINLKQPVMEWDGTTLQNISFKNTPSGEINPNPNFYADTDYTKGTGWTIADGKATSDASQVADSKLTVNTVTLTVDDSHDTIMIVTGRTVGTVWVELGTATGTARSTNDTFAETITCTDTNEFSVVCDLSFDGSVTLYSVKHEVAWTGEFRAKYCTVRDERAIYANIFDNSTNFPHLMIGSSISAYDEISASQRPSSSLGAGDPFYLIQPDLRAINGMVQGFSVIATSSAKGSSFYLAGSSAQDFAFKELHPQSGSSGNEALTYVGNDIMYGRQGRIESLISTDKFGDVDADDLSLGISDEIEGFDDWTIVYNSRKQVVYCYPEGEKQIWVYHKTNAATSKLSPWSKWVTSHEMEFDMTATMNCYSPVDGLEYVFFGDENGNVYQMEGTGSNGDGGTNKIKCERLSAMINVPLDTEVFNLQGWVTYRKIDPENLVLRFEYQGYNLFNEEITVTLTPDADQIYYGDDVYYGGEFYYGTVEQRFAREKLGVSGGSNQFQVRTTIEGDSDFAISEIGLRFEVASAS